MAGRSKQARFVVLRRGVAVVLAATLLLCAAWLLRGRTGSRGPGSGGASPHAGRAFQHVRVLVDPGHGGIDGGTNLNGILEKNINLAVALELHRQLGEAGLDSTLTRTEDVDLGGKNTGNRWRRDLEARLQQARNKDVQLMVSLHTNSSRKSSERGPMVFYPNGSVASQQLGAAILDSLGSVARPNMPQPISARFYILRQSTIPTVLVEMGFLTNPDDRRLLLKPEYQQEVAAAITRGILAYLSGPTTP